MPMNNKINNRINEIRFKQAVKTAKAKTAGTQFQDILADKINSGDRETTFSKHALARLAEREIQLSAQDISKLDQAIDMARQKGIRNSLIVTDQVVYIANVESKTIITAMSDMKGKVFTNVDGVVNI